MTQERQPVGIQRCEALDSQASLRRGGIVDA